MTVVYGPIIIVFIGVSAGAMIADSLQLTGELTYALLGISTTIVWFLYEYSPLAMSNWGDKRSGFWGYSTDNKEK